MVTVRKRPFEIVALHNNGLESCCLGHKSSQLIGGVSYGARAG